MKQLLVITILTVLCIGCNKDDNGGSSQGDSSLTSGKWYYESSNGEEGDECDKMSSIEFKTDGKFIIDPYGYSDPAGGECAPMGALQGTYTVSGNSMSVTVFGETASGTYTVSETTLVTNGTIPFIVESENTTWDKTSG